MRPPEPIFAMGALHVAAFFLALAVLAGKTSASQPLSVFKSPDGKAAFMASYDAALAQWPVPYESICVPTRFGATHVIAGGPKDGGHATPLVLLHAFGTGSTVWLRNISQLSRTYRTYLVDIIGDANKSVYTRPLTSRSDYVDWLSDVLDALEIKQAHLGGLSYGGWLTLNFALAVPERLRSIILLAPAASLLPFRLSFYVHFLGPLLFPTRATVESTFRWLSARGEVVDDRLSEQMYLAVKHFHFPKGGVYPTVFTDDELRRISLPTLLLIGDHEVIYNPRAALKRAQELIPNVQAELVPDAGHLLVMEQAEIVNRRMLDFLEGTISD